MKAGKIVLNSSLGLARREQSALPDDAFAALIFLEKNEVKKVEEIARESSAVFEVYPHWKESPDQEREVKFAFYKALKGSLGTKEMARAVFEGGLRSRLLFFCYLRWVNDSD